MTDAHLMSFIAAADAQKDKAGWWTTDEGRHMTLYASFAGSSLTISRIEALRHEGEQLHAKTVRGELYVVALADVFAAQVEGQPKAGGRRAGFV